ncbi:hypothetical protein [Mycobacterium sp.]|uniref:hypothetical protein n=1 Tax=Mycobacterium sp. TaxID=1785 RepID=UPI002CE51158|nr:hypothetical protein [Mycobacterium sp.]HKP43378.1 hypothetical protein [Mycobacterium sp.]
MRGLVDAVGLPLDVGDSLSTELGGTNAADGATALADTVAESLWVAVVGARLAALCAGADAGAAVDDAGAAVDDAAGGSLVDGATTRGAGGSVLVDGGFTAVVGVATVDGATIAAVLVCAGDGGGCGACV